MTREQLIKKWREVNMHTQPGKLKDKHIVMMLPLRDKVINPEEVMEEINIQKQFNDFKILRTKGGHYRTVITKTIVYPKSILGLLKDLEKDP